jgi:hypothetical protein
MLNGVGAAGALAACANVAFDVSAGLVTEDEDFGLQCRPRPE